MNKKAAVILLMSLTLMGIYAGGASEQKKGGPIEVGVTATTSGDGLAEREWIKEFNASQSEIFIKIIDSPPNDTEMYRLHLQGFEAQSGEIDIIRVGVQRIGDMNQYLIDLNAYPELVATLENNFPAINQTGYVGKKLAVVPRSINGGMLIYRQDLLSRYGYNSPPKTWDDLETMALKVQQGERAAGNSDFWGFVWQGQAYEGLTCDALEWIYSNGGGTIVNDDRVITIDNPQAQAALERARGWIGNITPPGVLSFKEEESRAVFQGGNAVFMRNWPYAYNLAEASDSSLKGKTAIAPLPAGASGHGASTTGTWFWGVSRYSEHPEAAVKVIMALTSREVQKRIFLASGSYPTIPAIYQDPDVLSRYPFMPQLLKIFGGSPVNRPATATSPNYEKVSVAFQKAVYSVLNGESRAKDALASLALDIADITGLETAS